MTTQLSQSNKQSNFAPTAEQSILRKSEDDTLHDEHPQKDADLQMKSVYMVSNGGVPPGSSDGDNNLNNSKLFDYLKVQPKLTIGQPNDKYEQEADRVADQVMRMPEDDRPGGQIPANVTVQRSCSSCGEEESSLQTKPLYSQISPLIQRQPIEEEEEMMQPKLLIQRQPVEEEEQIQTKPMKLQKRGKSGQASAVVALRAQPQLSRQPRSPLSWAARAVQYNNFYYDSKSIIIIENIVNATPDGRFSLSDAQAVFTYQQNNSGLGTDGMVGENTLNVMIPDLVRQREHSKAINLVTDFYNVNMQEVLSIRYDATISGSRTSFESGYLYVIRIGPQAFRSATTLLNAISSVMTTIAPGHMAMHVPQRLSQVQVQAAITANKKRIQDNRSILAIQELVQAPISGVIDTVTSQNIAEYQFNRGLMLNPDGRIDSRHTFRIMVSKLIDRRHYNSVIRLIIDYFNLPTHGALLDISYGPQTTQAGWIPGTTTLRIGQVWFGRSFPRLVHQIAHMLDRVRTRKAGIIDYATRVFLGEAVEILSIGIPEESFRNFMIDARRALTNWNNMSRPDRRQYWMRFQHVLTKVHQRYTLAAPAQQQNYRGLIQAYFSVQRP